MKNLVFAIGLAATVVACKNSTMEVLGTTKGFEDGTKVYLMQEDTLNPMTPIKLDSTEIKSNQFSFKNKKVEEIDFRFVQLGKDGAVVAFIQEAGKVEIEIDAQEPEKQLVKGTKNNDGYYEYMKQGRAFQEEASKREKEFMDKNQAAIDEAHKVNDQATMDRIDKEYAELRMKIGAEIQENAKKQAMDFVSNKKDLLISVLLLEGLHINQAIETKEMQKYFESFSDEVKNSRIGKRFSHNYILKNTTDIGDTAPDFSAKTPEGKEVSLNSVKGKVTIIDFWASWCPPCREANPEMVKIYEKYKDKGLSIIGVSLDSEADKWKGAIEKDKLTWTQISNLKGWEEPIAKTYSVKSIPAIFILDEKGVIVAKNLHGEELENKLAELLK